jgi:hypothetical protein
LHQARLADSIITDSDYLAPMLFSSSVSDSLNIGVQSFGIALILRLD